MSFDMRRRQEGTRKRGYLDSTLETSSLANSNNNTTTDNSNNNTSSYGNNQNNYVSSKAYAVHDPSLEDLDRLIMFITESKQIQGRYYVRYLPGMMNSSGELTPCNYRPTFSFSPPRSPASTTFSTTPTTTYSSSNNCYNNNRSRTLANNRSTFPDVVDLTKEDDMISQSGSNKDFLSGARPNSDDGQRLGRSNSYNSSSDSEKNEGKRENESSYSDNDDDDNDEKSGLGPSSGTPAGSTSTSPVFTNTNRKQTARKSMRTRTEIRPCEIPEINTKSDEEEEVAQENSHSITHLNTGQETSSSVDDTSVSESKNKSSISDNSSNNNHSNDNTASSSSSSRANVVNNISPSPSNNTSRGLSEKWNLLDGITVTVNPDFG